CFYFFFSSRRRHTRWPRDWSSDVCSSDLNPAVFLHYLKWRSRLPLGEGITVSDEIDLWGCYLNNERFGMLAESGKVIVANSSTRSEERRVGKECRSRRVRES